MSICLRMTHHIVINFMMTSYTVTIVGCKSRLYHSEDLEHPFAEQKKKPSTKGLQPTGNRAIQQVKLISSLLYKRHMQLD
jgi:hypothetical protein